MQTPVTLAMVLAASSCAPAPTTTPAPAQKPNPKSPAGKPDATYSHGGFVVTATLLEGDLEIRFGDVPPEPECVATKRRDIVLATINIATAARGLP